MRLSFFTVSLATATLVKALQLRAADSAPLLLPLHLYTRQILKPVLIGNATDDMDTGFLPVTVSHDQQAYYAVIMVGDISFRVALDTGSSDLWLMSSACSTPTCKAVPTYPLAYHSPTFVPVNNNLTVFNASYADGTAATGFIARETVQLSNLTVPNQAFGVVTTSNVRMDDQISGLMGLGFPRLSTISRALANATPFFPTLAQEGKLGYPLFGLSLHRNSSGSLAIGAIDASVVKNISGIGWNPVVPFSPIGLENNVSSYLQWTIPISSISVNGTDIFPIPSYSTRVGGQSLALFDIGTRGLYGPYQDVTRIFGLIEESRLVDPSGLWAIPCATSATISLTFGSQTFTLQPLDYLIGPAAGNPNLCLTWPKANMPSPDGIDWQIGTTFLSTIYTVFSYGINTKEPPMIGLYSLQNSTNTTASPNVPVAFFSSISATIATTLPNFPLQTPSYTTPPYAFNTSVQAPAGLVVASELATSTYSAVIGTGSPDVTTLPVVSPAPTAFTLFITDASGAVITSVSEVPQPSITLGRPPGWNAALSMRVPMHWTLFFSYLFPIIYDVL